MVLKQCVACNHRVPGSQKTCVCGHVFTQTKMIGGRRYSGYRARLYSRSELGSQRKSVTKKSTRGLMIHKEKRVNKRLGINPKPKRRSSKEMTTNDDHLTNKPEQLQKCKPSHHYIDFKSLDEALNDINQKMARQSLLWIVLKSSKY